MNRIAMLNAKRLVVFKHQYLLIAFLLITSIVVLKSVIISSAEITMMPSLAGDPPPQINASPVPYDIVFVSRKIRKNGSVLCDTLTDLPGTGVHGHFREYAPGKLQIYTTAGTLITLIDGSNPTPASLNLIDVNAPEVSYDGTKIVFSGLTAPPVGTIYDSMPARVLGAWRIYKINVNGTGLTQLTTSNLSLDLTQFNMPVWSVNYFDKYDDTDPCFLPDGRICFSSTRYPVYCQYGNGRATNLYLMNNNGTGMHRITSEKNGADRPMLDPLTGQIVFSRWWHNYRFPIDDMSTIPNADNTGYIRKDGLSSDKNQQNGGYGFMVRNGWQLSAINPDGTGLHLFAGGNNSEKENFGYGGSFTSTGDIITNVYAGFNLYEIAGFGGLRKHVRGAGHYENFLGLTDMTDTAQIHAPVGTLDAVLMAYSVKGYATEPDVLPDGRIICSYSNNYKQDYGLYVVDSTGTNKTLIYNQNGTSELRAKAIRARALPPVITDQITQVAATLPPLENGPYNSDGTFTFNCLNVYANADVDVEIPSAPKVGSAASIRFFIDHQRTHNGSKDDLDFPILLSELPVTTGGAVLSTNAPANVQLFEQLRSSVASGYKVPFTGVPYNTGTASVGGMNYGRPGSVATCVGCHRGHTTIPVPAIAADAEWTNVAPGATVTVSSARNSLYINSLIDRKVQLTKEDDSYWASAISNYTNQWVKLGFDVPIKVRNVRLYNIPYGSKAASDVQIHQAIVYLYADKSGTQLITSKTVNVDISENGTDVLFSDVNARSVKIKITNVTGRFFGSKASGLAEVEVIASANASQPRISTTMSDYSASIFPNPVNDFANLEIKNPMAEELTYILFDATGKLILKNQIHVDYGNVTTTALSFSAFKNGVYFLKTSCAGKDEILRIVKL